MYVNQARNVCQALSNTIHYLSCEGRAENSRGGEVIVAPVPIMTITECPRERVLFSQTRDANPFFALAEAMWMLAGRYDAEFLDRYVHNFSKLYAQKDGVLHGAYGWRWRHGFDYDQLDVIVEKLKKDPFDRQCVLQMWDASSIYNDLRGDWADRPCNTHCYVRVNENRLDLTVCCRSNDMIWGAHGANAVHFSILQEYLAARIGVNMGVLYQLSNNAHAYTKTLANIDTEDLKDDRYYTESVVPLLMFDVPEAIDADVGLFMQNMDDDTLQHDNYSNSWFFQTLAMAMLAHKQFKAKKIELAIELAYTIGAIDWRIATTEWLERRAV